MRYETGDLSRLPGDLEQKIQSGRYRAAAVGACDAGSSQGFTRFRVAVLLYYLKWHFIFSAFRPKRISKREGQHQDPGSKTDGAPSVPLYY